WVYGAVTGPLEGEPLRERDPLDAARTGHPYVASKLAAELLLHSYLATFGQHFTILRYGIPFGPRMRDELVIARFVAAARSRRPITIAGSGAQSRNYVYVTDLAEAHVKALAAGAEDQTLALEGAAPVSVRDIADTVCALVGPT